MNKIAVLLGFVLILPAFGQIGSYGELYDAILDGSASAIPATGAPGDGPAPYVRQSGRQTYYTSEATFQMENPGLTTEDFEMGLAAPGAVVTCGPVISAAASPCFAAGGFVEGLEMTPSTLGNDMVILGSGVVGNTSIVGGANTFTDDTVLTFTNGGVFSVGMYLLVNVQGGEILDIDIYGPGGLIDSTTAAASEAGLFWGVRTVGVEEITQIVISSPSGSGELVDNIQFRVAQAIPTLGTWGLGAFLLLLLVGGIFFMRRQRTA